MCHMGYFSGVAAAGVQEGKRPVPEFEIVLYSVIIVGPSLCHGGVFQGNFQPHGGGCPMHRCGPQRQFYGVATPLELRDDMLGRESE